MSARAGAPARRTNKRARLVCERLGFETDKIIPSSSPNIMKPQRQISQAPTETAVIDSPRGFPFLLLPAEIRIAIYRLLLVWPGTLEVVGTPDERPVYYLLTEWSECICPKEATNMEPAILCVNKQLHQEAASVFYGENRFSFYSGPPSLDPYCWHKELARPIHSPFSFLTPQNAKLIRRCEILVMLMGVSVASTRSCFELLRGWLEEFVYEKLGADNEHPQHSLREVLVLFGDYRDDATRRPGSKYLQEHGYQFILEPLAALHGVAKVEVAGRVTGPFRQDLTKAMKADQRLVERREVEPRMERYRRRGKVFWRKKPAYRAYYEQRMIWRV